MDAIPKIISQNPFRILGVHANASQRDIVANKSKATAFLKVNRAVEYPLDLKGILPPLSRSVEMMNEADARLTIVKDKIKYTQFWFLKQTPLDDIAFNHLIAGNMDEAISIWNKQDNLSSLQNRMICNMIKGNLTNGIALGEQLYLKYGSEYVNKIDNTSTFVISSNELIHQFIDSIGVEIGMSVLMKYTRNQEWKEYIGNQTVAPLISKILVEVENTKKVDHKDPKARIEAARKLVRNTKDAFQELKSILSENDLQYQMIADKLGLEILQCGIDYFNNSDDNDAPYTAMKMQKYAQSVVVGNLAKQRCDENVNILQKIIDNLPPKEVIAEDKAVKAELEKFVRLPDKISYALTLLNNTKPHLQSIKRKLGATNDYYLKLSTQIVGNALHNVIEEVNAVQISENSMDEKSLVLLKMAIREAWKAITIMEEFDIENGLKLHFNKNREILEPIYKEIEMAETRSRLSHMLNYHPYEIDPDTFYTPRSISSRDEEDDENKFVYYFVKFIIAILGILYIIFCFSVR